MEIKMKVKMLKSYKYSFDGINLTEFKEGELYEVDDYLMNRFIDEGCIEILENEEVAEPIQAPKKKGKKKSNDAVVEEQPIQEEVAEVITEEVIQEAE
jgi:hypothetical protein